MNLFKGRISGYLLTLFLVIATLIQIKIPIVSSQASILKSKIVDMDLPLDPGSKLWSESLPLVMPLSGQVVAFPKWPDAAIKSIEIRSINNGKEIAFMLTWKDSTKNDKLTPEKFRDGAAIQFPIGPETPFFCMGQADNFSNIWHWKADWQTDIDRMKAEIEDAKKGPKSDSIIRFELIPKRATPIEDLIGGGFSTLTTKTVQAEIMGNGIWEDDTWKVIFKRSLLTAGEYDVQLNPGRIKTISFAVWDGENKERNGMKAVSTWVQLLIDATS
jgi:hypothetical protein